MEPMYLRDVEAYEGDGKHGETIRQMTSANFPVPQIQYLFAFKPKSTYFLDCFTEEVMRGPSELEPGQRELIAAFTSRLNECLF
jgi:hypothetical protein